MRASSSAVFSRHGPRWLYPREGAFEVAARPDGNQMIRAGHIIQRVKQHRCCRPDRQAENTPSVGRNVVDKIHIRHNITTPALARSDRRYDGFGVAGSVVRPQPVIVGFDFDPIGKSRLNRPVTMYAVTTGSVPSLKRRINSAYPATSVQGN